MAFVKPTFRSSISAPAKKKTYTLLSYFSLSRHYESGRARWQPHVLRPSVLISTALICWTLIVILQLLLVKSIRQKGILFAPDVNKLPLTHSFLYLYFPTVIAVVYSILWSFIDLEAKRLEPYYQLSKAEGASGRESLLLHYPFDFLPLVPVTAFRKRHWSVFYASTAVVTVAWGLVPTQAGIFTVSSISRNFPETFIVADGFLPAAQQPSEVSLHYAQSSYGIVALNESLPEYMSQNYTLAPFKSMNDSGDEDSLWTAPTTLFSLDLRCEQSRFDPYPGEPNKVILGSSNGCGMNCLATGTYSGNYTIGPSGVGNDTGPFYDFQEFMSVYAGYWNDEGTADYYLQSSCPPLANHTFFAGFTRNKRKSTDPPNNITAIWCEPFYYSQVVNATVKGTSKMPQKVVPLGQKVELPSEFFNSSMFEYVLNTNVAKVQVRGALPMRTLPDAVDRLPSGLTKLNGISDTLNFITALAILTTNYPLEDYLNFETLGTSYEIAYRLLFARYMSEVIANNFTSSHSVLGERQISTEAVVLEPTFTFLVEALLGLVSCLALALLYISVTRKLNLQFDPSTIASVMSMVANKESVLKRFEELDICDSTRMEKEIGDTTFKVVDGEVLVVTSKEYRCLDNQAESGSSHQPGDGANIVTKPVRPVEFSVPIGVTFILAQAILAAVLATLFIKSFSNGLPLPSGSKLVQNILENYIPTAIATLIEPMWVLLNRLLCMLQPLEDLRRGQASASRSIDADYSSLPPQLVMFKAIRSRHFVLALVCMMSILANVLAIAFSGLFFQDSRDMVTTRTFVPPFSSKFVALNGSIGPHEYFVPRSSGAYRGGDGEDQFYIAEANFTIDTPLPSWTDNQLFYLPYMASQSISEEGNVRYRASTWAFGASLDCSPLTSGVNYSATLSPDGGDVWGEDGGMTKLNATLIARNGTAVQCIGAKDVQVGPVKGLEDGVDVGGYYSCYNGTVAAEFVIQLQATPNATQFEVDTCTDWISLGWARNPSGSCGSVKPRTWDAHNSLWVACRPEFVSGDATVTVDAKGQLTEPVGDANISAMAIETVEEWSEHFGNDPKNLLQQSQQYLFYAPRAVWHSDAFDSDFLNHFIARESNSSRLLDPSMGPPSFQDVEEVLKKTYSRLFAIWLGAYKERLLVPAQNQSTILVAGLAIQPSKRLFLSTPMFAIGEGILCLYVIVAFCVYLRRPGRFLPRLPTSIASIISLFAASTAVRLMRGTSHMSRKDRRRHLKNLGVQYGFGSYIAAGGRIHIGIERAPFVRVRKRRTWLERKIRAWRKS